MATQAHTTPATPATLPTGLVYYLKVPLTATVNGKATRYTLYGCQAPGGGATNTFFAYALQGRKVVAQASVTLPWGSGENAAVAHVAGMLPPAVQAAYNTCGLFTANRRGYMRYTHFTPPHGCINGN